MIISELLLRHHVKLLDLNVINIDRHTIIAKHKNDSDTVLMIYKHAIDTCRGIPFNKLEQNGDSRYSQTAYLNYWSKNKFIVDIKYDLNDTAPDYNIECTIWNANNDYMIFLERDYFINKHKVQYIVGPELIGE